jgi:two-component system response regulator
MTQEMDEVEILLVEDTAADAELAIRALKKRGLANHLVWVKDGAEALDFLFATGAFAGRDLAKPPRVVLLDLRLPKIGGVEVLRRIKADERTRGIPVVVITSSREDADLDECYKVGVNSYICKPIGFDEFSKIMGDLGLYWLLVNKLPGG